MADHAVVADARLGPAVGGVHHGAVLDGRTRADADGHHVAAHRGAEPDAALGAHDDVADQATAGRKESVRGDDRGVVSVSQDDGAHARALRRKKAPARPRMEAPVEAPRKSAATSASSALRPGTNA